MRGKKKLLAALPTLDARELVLIARDIHRAADAAAIGGASEREWYDYLEAEDAALKELERRFPGTDIGGFYNREGEKELKAIYRKIMCPKKAKAKKDGAEPAPEESR